MAGDPSEFFQLSQHGRADEGTDMNRSVVADNVPLGFATDGQLIAELKKPLKARLTGRIPLEDIPWCDSTAPIVSDRVRGVLEVQAPGQVQFLAVEMSVRKKPTSDTYWLLNTLRVHDCYHRTRSKWTVLSTPAKTWWSFDKLVIDTARVPVKTLIFRESHFETPLFVRRRLRDAIQAAGITGAQFYSVDQA